MPVKNRKKRCINCKCIISAKASMCQSCYLKKYKNFTFLKYQLKKEANV